MKKICDIILALLIVAAIIFMILIGYEYIRRIGDMESIIELSTQINLKELKDLNDFRDLKQSLFL